ncbi:MAG: type 1 glutamine amidotransferase [bacterium]|nr:type 1 glutamine amidotransferase [bacterium]
MKDRTQLQCLLVQAREDVVTLEEELCEFTFFGGIAPSQCTVLNIFETPEYQPEMVDAFDCVFVGGSSSEGEDLLEWKKPYVLHLGALLVRAYQERIPTFASCLGFQASAVALGGVLIQDKKNMEMGSYPIYTTDEGKKDPLFKTVSDGFLAISGHAKRVEVLPPHAIHMAYSALCPIHAYKMDDAPFYATQFHPEVTAHDLRERLARYKAIYLDGDDEFERIAKETQETPEANSLIGTFVDIVVAHYV